MSWIPSHLVKDCFPVIIHYTNHKLFLQLWFSPSHTQTGCYHPVLKSRLSPDIMSKIQPVRRFHPKFLECVFASQDKAYLDFQSGFCSQYSTDLLLSSDSLHISIPNLPDLTEAFDTINHTFPISCLESSYNITIIALSWLRSCFANKYDRNKYDRYCIYL